MVKQNYRLYFHQAGRLGEMYLKKRISKVAYPFLTVIFLLSLMLTLNTSAFAAGPQVLLVDTLSNGELFVPGEILIKFKPNVPRAVIDSINQTNGVTRLETTSWGLIRAQVPENMSVEQMVAIYSHNPNVEYAEPNSICHAVFSPDDFFYAQGYQWNLDNPATGGIHMEQAWELSTGTGVTVAVLDTGIAYEDYDIYQKAPDFAITKFVDGYDFINGDSHANDDNAHGTHVAGTIAQSTNNQIGTAGIAYNATLMPVKVLDANGSGTALSLSEGLHWAAENGAKIINMSLSFGFVNNTAYNPGTTVCDEIKYAYDKGVTLVAAAGNEKKRSVAYPAAYEECIAVGATRYDENLAPYTNKGTALDLTAPGGDFKVDQNGDGWVDGILQQTFDPNSKDPTEFGYWFFEGTSMASPHVAGVAALVIASLIDSGGDTNPANVRQILEATAEDHGASGWDTNYGWGIVDAYAALSLIDPPPEPPLPELPTIGLFSLGLASVGGFIWFKRRRKPTGIEG